jgi:hypothetical protein
MHPTLSSPVVIRFAGAADEAALDRLARLDSTVVPAGVLLVAEVDGALVAARAVDGDEHIADPFQPTTGILALLDLQARRLRPPRGRRLGGRLSLRLPRIRAA